MAEHNPTDGGAQTADHESSEGTERVREVIRDGFAIMLGAAWWAFDQTDRWAHTFLHEGEDEPRGEPPALRRLRRPNPAGRRRPRPAGAGQCAERPLIDAAG